MSSYGEAFSKKRSNEVSTWSPAKPELLAEPFAAARIHKNANNGFATVRSTSTYKMGRDASLFCVGSCFAREIEDAISEMGLHANTKREFLELMASNPTPFQRREGVIGKPHAFLNRYNLGSMGDLMEIVAGLKEDGDALLFPAGKETFHDYHYTRFLKEQSHEVCLERRALITNTYRKAAKSSDIFIFTFGLCESFYDLDSERYLNVTPDPRTAQGQSLGFEFLSFEENLRQGERIIRAVQSLNPEAHIFFTVSPVPLDVTFTENDIIIANNLAKSTLILTAATLTERYDNCHYFPSFEMVTSSAQEKAWLWDRKHVSKPMVDHIMKNFITQHINQN